jgi:hypothetical protein
LYLKCLINSERRWAIGSAALLVFDWVDAFLRRFLSSGRYGEKCAQWVFIFDLFYKMSHSVPELELQGAKTFGWSQNEVSAPAPGQTKNSISNLIQAVSTDTYKL